MRYSSSSDNNNKKNSAFGRILGLAAVGIAGAAAVVAYPIIFDKGPPPGPRKAEIEFEKPRKQPESKEENRELVSSQHLQVKKSWEKPGVYAWGSNTGKVAAPDSDEPVIKTPRRIPFFDGQILRDLKLDRNFGAAVTENGDLVQWGVGFSGLNPLPTVTLKGKDLVKLALSRDRVIALSSDGSVYSIPVSEADQKPGEKGTTSSSGTSFWSGQSPVSFRTLKPDLGWGDKVTDIKSGLEHCLLLTSKGKVFSAASSSEDYPARGQLGIPGLTWATRPNGPYDQPHAIPTLHGFDMDQIAAGDYHSMVLDKDGKIFVWGDNSAGQLGLAPELDTPFIDVPSLLPVEKLYSGTGFIPRVTAVSAGGSNSFFTVLATKKPGQPPSPTDILPARGASDVTADVWACGEGIHGSLGTGKWTHISEAPTKVKALSNLSEFDEKSNKLVPIRLSSLSVGSDHAAAVMDNVTSVKASESAKTTENDTNWGADVLWWGGNEHYQLGTGKRNNVASPTYIGPLDGGKGDAEKGRKGEEHRFQITPRTTVRLGEEGQGRKATVMQRIECGRMVSAVYSAVPEL